MESAQDARRGATSQTTEASLPQVFEPGDVYTKGSRVYIHVDKTGLGHEHAVEGMLKSGNLHLGGKDAGGELVFDMTTFDADTAAARKYLGLEGSTDESTRKKVNANMRGSDVLNIARFPTAIFKLTSIKPTNRTSDRKLPQYRLEGEFTLHGVTREIDFLADVETKGSWQHLQGNFQILQSQFGMKPYTAAFGAVGVADRLTIWGDLWIAEQQVALKTSTTNRR